MTLKFRGHFDGRAIIPDEPADLPVDQPIDVTVETAPLPQGPSDEQRRQALRRLLARAVQGANIPLESLRRENLYEER